METVKPGRDLLLALVLLVLFGGLCFYHLEEVGLVDYDEACYAEVTRQMMLNDDYLNPVLNGEPFFEKPPLLYWSQVLGYEVFGLGPLGARAATATAALLLLLVVFAFARRPLGGRAAFFSAVVLGSSMEFIGLARIAFTDMLLALWLMLVLGCLHRAFESLRQGKGTGWFLAACFFSGLAMLTKGAIGLVLPGAAAFVFLLFGWRVLDFLRRPTWYIPGFLIVTGVGFSWYLLLGLTGSGGFGFMQELFLEHHVGRFTDPMQGHSGPFFYYVPVLLVGFLPWSPFLILGITRSGLGRRDEERARFLRLMVFFGGMTFVFFSVAATKLPNYIAPVLPCAALLIGNLWERESGRDLETSRAWSWSLGFTAGALFLIALVFLALPLVLPRLPEILGSEAHKQPGLQEPVELGLWPFGAAACLLAGGVGALRAWKKRRLFGVAGWLAGSAVVFLVVLSFGLLPRFDAHFRAPLRNLAQRAATEISADEAIVLVSVRHVPSVNFYGDRRTQYVSRRSASGLENLFRGPEPRVGITVDAYFERVTERGRAEVIERSGGYVLFRCLPASADGSGS